MLLFLPVLAGLLLAASFPLLNLNYLAWVACVPLIFYVYRVKSPAAAFWGGYIAGGIQFFWLLVWMPTVLEQYGGLSLVLAWIAYTLLILLLACFPGIVCLTTKVLMRRGGDTLLLLFPFFWILVEVCQTAIPFNGFPWLSMGYSQSDRLTLIQIADLTGVFGISFLLVWFSVSVCHAGIHRGRGFRAWWPLCTAVVLVSTSLVYGTVALDRWNAVPSDYSVIMLQGNLSQDDPLSVLREKHMVGYTRMLENLHSDGADLLLLPESPTPLLFQQNRTYQRILEGLARGFTFGLIFNNIRVENSPEGSHYYNSAYYLDGEGNARGVYDKIHLVPFGEYIPAKNLFVFVKTITQDAGEFQPGNNYKVFTLDGHPVNVIICYEAIFPGLVRDFIRDGSRLIVNLTNDGWYGSSSAPYQHFNITRWRAIENRRYFLRATNTGISAVIEPSGKVQSSTGILREAVCEGHFGFVSQQTFYTLHGDVFTSLCAIIVCGCTIFVYIKGRKRHSFHK